VGVLHARLARQAHDALQPPVDEGAPERVVAGVQALLGRGHWLLHVLLVARRERVSVFLERAQPQFAERGGIGARQDPYGHSDAPFR
jgi:hypothetical protein